MAMKHLKILSLAAVATMALMAFASTASATKLYSGASALGAGTQIKASLEGSSTIKNGETTLNTCTATQFGSEVTNAGGAALTVSLRNLTIDFENCVNPIHSIALGSLEIHYTSGLGATVTASGLVISITIFGTSCQYEVGTGMDMGSLTGSTSGNATLHVNATIKGKIGNSFICPSTPTWTATFRVTSPSSLHVTAS
jgi:hypothetical protein